MGNFHCIFSTCATVVYREYLAPKIRWRYEGEDWQEIEADSFNLDRGGRDFEGGQCCDLTYRVFVPTTVRYFNDPNRPFYDTVYQRDLKPNGKVLGIEFDNTQKRENGISRAYKILYEQCDGTIRSLSISSNSNTFGWLDSSVKISKVEALNGEIDDCEECIFTVFKNGQKVYTETRNICPEVEKIPCKLSDVRQEIKIQKKAWREKIQVVGEDNRQDLFGDFREAAEKLISGDIPNNCREIWRTITLDFGTDNFTDFDSRDFASYYQQISTICSAENCPPPEYEVICDCKDNCESCPPNTCPVECENNICCYDKTTGKSIKSIPINNYCGE